MLYAHEHELSGMEIFHDPDLNKGTAFTAEERDKLGLRGLLPPHVTTIEEQELRVLDAMRSKARPIDKYTFLIGLQERNRTLFYRTVINNLEEIMPIIYTPTVGQACQEYGHTWRRPQGLFISLEDKGNVETLLNNWPEDDVRVIVVTDGERILGLGDLGANGMGIPVGKLSLYTACAGIAPKNTLPVTIDVGTNTETIKSDALYLGLKRERERGPAYDELIEEFVNAVQKRFPNALIQFEDFGNKNAFRLLEKYRNEVCTFNDDIQGTAAVTVAGIFSALRITGKPIEEQTVMFLGAGEAGIGIGDLLVADMVERGIPADEARKRCWYVDSTGLVVKSRTDLAHHKLPYAHDAEFIPDLLTAIKTYKPTILVGVSGVARTFTKEIVELMSSFNDRPMIFALSNPTSKSECTAEEAYTWSKGKAIYASGSPFDPVTYNGVRYVSGQANNSYVFPGIGLGVVISNATRVTDEMFLAAAKELASLVQESDLEIGRIFPPLTEIRNISAHIAVVVAKMAEKQGVARIKLPATAQVDYARAQMWKPEYQSYV